MTENTHVAFDADLCRANPEAAADEIARLDAKLYNAHLAVKEERDIATAAEARASDLEREVERLTGALAFADEHARKIEAMLDPFIDWRAALTGGSDHA